MNIRWNKYLFTFMEFYSHTENKNEPNKADIYVYFQQPQLVHSKKLFSIHRRALHLCINLKKSEEQLLKDMDSNIRYKIRRAQRDNVRIEFIKNPTMDDIFSFASYYNAFAKKKGIEACKIEKLVALMKANMLLVSSAYHPDGTKVASNVVITNKESAIGLYSCSSRLFNQHINKQFISRANCYLSWCLFTYFKQLGYHTFDLMGLTMDKENIDHQRVNTYKKSFGGEEKIKYQSFIPQSLKGTLLIMVLKVLWRKQTEMMKESDHGQLAHPHL